MNEGWNALNAARAMGAGPALCEDLALCYWSGHQSALDTFNAQPVAGAVSSRTNRHPADLSSADCNDERCLRPPGGRGPMAEDGYRKT
jgi:hypothetical protein